jgi:hypothetical protein
MQRKTRQSILVFWVALAFLAVSVLGGCSSSKNPGGNSAERKEDFEKTITAKTAYAELMHFDSNLDSRYDNQQHMYNWVFTKARRDMFERSSYTDCVFVHSAEDAKTHDDKMIVGWPSERTTVVLSALNRRVHEGKAEQFEWDYEKGERKIVDEKPLSEFSLEYPITTTDLVENWENVNALIEYLGQSLIDLLVDVGDKQLTPNTNLPK